MRDAKELRNELFRIDGKGYKAYKDIMGNYSFPNFTLYVDNVQSDPFAPPSRLRASIPASVGGVPASLDQNRARRVALEDFLARRFAEEADKCGKGKNTGGSGSVGIDACGQEILERTSMKVTADEIEVRFVVGLPARGRKALGRTAAEILTEQLPSIIQNSLFYENLDASALEKHVTANEDQWSLRTQLKEKGLVAFVGNNAVLPRRSGVSDKPMQSERAVPFYSPPEMECTFTLPNTGEVKGMGIPEGVSLVIGGGYHGKSTLLRAIERGVYDHVPGDGREFVVARNDAMKIRAEDGRSVEQTDIHGFINDLPGGEQTHAFSSENASGSTSQAANIAEALECGTGLLLLDEDTSATNFMIRDGRMQRLVNKEEEPITPFVDRVKELHERLGVSTILVLGGSGDYFDVADTIIRLCEFRPADVTKDAKEVAAEYQTERVNEGSEPLAGITQRAPVPKSFDLGPKGKIKAKGRGTIMYGRESVSLAYVEQVVDQSQTNAIAELFRYLKENHMGDNVTLSQAVDQGFQDIEQYGLDVISPFFGKHPGNLALPRKQDVCAALNRYRYLKVKQL